MIGHALTYLSPHILSSTVWTHINQYSAYFSEYKEYTNNQNILFCCSLFIQTYKYLQLKLHSSPIFRCFFFCLFFVSLLLLLLFFFVCLFVSFFVCLFLFCFVLFCFVFPRNPKIISSLLFVKLK